MKVTEATRHVLRNLRITTKFEFLKWRQDNGAGLVPFYNMVKQISTTHWRTLSAPEAGVRGTYERTLPGYKVCKT